MGLSVISLKWKYWHHWYLHEKNKARKITMPISKRSPSNEEMIGKMYREGINEQRGS